MIEEIRIRDLGVISEAVLPLGPGFTAMRERAAIYGGSVEVTKVPGVGFTVSAIFPRLREFAAIAPQRR